MLSRQFLTIGGLLAQEPVLADDGFLPHTDPSQPAWLVTTLDIEDDVPVARTFALVDGTNWFAEITATGAVALERRAPIPSGGTVLRRRATRRLSMQRLRPPRDTGSGHRDPTA